jgi:hypothetical protein
MMSRHIHLVADRRGAVHPLWTRMPWLHRRTTRLPGTVSTVRSCNCSVLLVRFLIWATRNAPHAP